MTEQGLSSRNAPSSASPKDINASTKKKSSRSLLVVFLAFAAFLTIVFLTQHKTPIDWVEDYQAGLELARKENKPVLLVFYKQFTPMSTDSFNDTYINPDVKEFVEQNFIPILIDVEKHPEIAKQYNISYYPTHYVRRPDGDELFGPRMGYDPPALFIKELKRLLKKMGPVDK